MGNHHRDNFDSFDDILEKIMFLKKGRRENKMARLMSEKDSRTFSAIIALIAGLLLLVTAFGKIVITEGMWMFAAVIFGILALVSFWMIWKRDF